PPRRSSDLSSTRNGWPVREPWRSRPAARTPPARHSGRGGTRAFGPGGTRHIGTGESRQVCIEETPMIDNELPAWLPRADGSSPWPQARVIIAGLGVAGFAAADALLEFGARVLVLDDARTEQVTDRATLLETLGAEIRLGPGSTATLPEPAHLVITTGFPPTAPLLVQAAARGVPIWSEVELAWRLSRPKKVIPWIGITGTNGKTSTTLMLEAMLAAAGLRTAAVGNIGRPIMEIVLDPEPYDVLAVELSSHQLHWSNSLSLHSAAVLNLQPDHLEWHGSAQGYRDAKAEIYQRVQVSCVYNVADPATEQMVIDAEVVEGARAIGFTL